MKNSGLILFDGVCNLCNSSINFVIDRDKEHCFRYAALQSKAGRRLMEENGLQPEDLASVVLLMDGKVYRKSSAALKVARHLRYPWPFLYGFMVIPVTIRDMVYDVIARNRYRWFGKKEECRVPTPELRKLFLDS